MGLAVAGLALCGWPAFVPFGLAHWVSSVVVLAGRTGDSSSRGLWGFAKGKRGAAGRENDPERVAEGCCLVLRGFCGLAMTHSLQTGCENAAVYPVYQ